MSKITFIGAGSTIFARSILGDSMLTESLQNSHIALYDIDGKRLAESKLMIETFNSNINCNRSVITAHLGVENRKNALRGADYVINAIQVGGYDPSTIIDFEIPAKYGLKQTIADTIGIGGIFRGLRTIPVMLEIARDMEDVCSDAWLLNYTNPMSIVTGGILKGSHVKTVGLCHSVQICTDKILTQLDMKADVKDLRWKIAGINHMAWLLEIADGKNDLYPEIRNRAEALNRAARKKGGEKHGDMVRFEIMKHFGYYVTESSEHNAEYSPFWIKSNYPHFIKEFNVPLNEYPRRCEEQIADWEKQRDGIINDPGLSHTMTHEYGAKIMNALKTGEFYRMHGNILNEGFIPNLPAEAIVEVPCLVDKNGVQGVSSGPLPEQCAALNRSNINVHLLTIEAALNLKKEAIFQAAYMDPHTSAELSLDDIRCMCDELIEAHGSYLPKYL